MKRYFNTILATALMCAAAVFVGCSDDYQGDIDSLGDRLTTLESQVSELKSEIANGAVITDVESTSTGIKITLSNDTSYSITNGTNGTDGTPGSIVEIGENGNWYIDGVDQGIAAEGQDGTPGADGTGTPGIDGTPGADGANGNYYLPDSSTGTFIEYVWNSATEEYEKGSDTGISFVAEGTVTAVKNEDGTVTITGVKDSEGNATTVTLGIADITSLLVSEASTDGFVFNSQCDMPIAAPYYLSSALPVQTLLSSNEAYKYIVNPSNATAPASWEMYAVTVATKASSETLAMKNTAYALASGYATVTGKFDVAKLPSTAANTEDRFYLQANISEEASVKSNNATIDPINLKAVFIGDAKTNTAYKTAAKDSDDYSTTIPLNTVTVPTTHQLLWSAGGSYDLAGYVYASAYSDITAATGRTWLENYKITDYSFRFSMPDTYLGTDNTTNQQKFATITEAGVMTLVSEWGTSAKERTPLVKVELMSDTDFGTALVVATAYFKVEFVDQVPSTTNKSDVTINMDKVTINYANLYTASSYEMTMTWTEMNQLVYNNAALQMSYSEFTANYDTTTPSITLATDSYGSLTSIPDTSGSTTPTDLYGLDVLGTTKWGTYTWTVTYTSKNPTLYGNVVIKHTFEVVEPTAQLPAFESVYVVNGVQITKGREVSSRHEMSVEPAEAFVNYLTDYLTVETALNLAYNSTLTYSSYITDPLLTGVELTNSTATTVTGIKSQVLSLTTALTTASKDVPMAFAVTYENGEKQSEAWTICFENPITVTFDALEIATGDLATTLDVCKYMTIKFNNSTAYSPTTGWDTDLKSKYGLDIKSMTATILDAADELTFAYDSSAYTGIFTWNNKGSKPQANFTGATVNVVVEGTYASSTAYAEMSSGNVNLTILKY